MTKKTRDLDWEIWEQVFNHVLFCEQDIVEQAFAVLEGAVPHYSTDYTASEELVKKMQDDGWTLRISTCQAGEYPPGAVGWNVKYNSRTSKHKVGICGVSLPRIICQAAIIAVTAGGKGKGHD